MTKIRVSIIHRVNLKSSVERLKVCFWEQPVYKYGRSQKRSRCSHRIFNIFNNLPYYCVVN